MRSIGRACALGFFVAEGYTVERDALARGQVFAQPTCAHAQIEHHSPGLDVAGQQGQ